MTKQSTVVAFYSSSDGAGQSCMVADIALILASQGRRVLVVDHDLTAPALHRYLSAFLPTASADTWNDTPTPLEGDFGHPDGAIDFLGRPTDDMAGPDPDGTVSPDGCTITWPDILARGYDAVLIDIPAGGGPARIVERSANVVVLGFTLNPRQRDRAMRLATKIEAGSRGSSIRILPVPMSVNAAEGKTTASRRIAAHRQFARLVENLPEAERQCYWDDVEIPHQADYADSEGLPFLDPPSADRDRLVSAHHRLAQRLLPGTPEPPALPLIPEETRRAYREARQDAAQRDNRVTVLHAAADRYWAEWIAAALRSMNFAVARRRIDQVPAEDPSAGTTLVVVSARLLGLPGVEDRLRQVIDRAQADSQIPGAVTIDDTWPSVELFPELGKVSLRGDDAKEAYEKLAAYYQLPESSMPQSSRAHFPGSRDGIEVNLPAFARELPGRDGIVDQIRDHFMARKAPPPLTLTGPAGVGKGQIALEYVARFRSYYDIIALIRADSVEAVQADLGKLAARKPPKRPAGDSRAAMLRELASGSGRHWLLIYTGADDPAVLDGLVPKGDDGHVLVTAEDAAAPGTVSLAVPCLSPGDAKTAVHGLVGGMVSDDAEWVATAMRGIPLALRLACAWLQVTADELELRGSVQATITQDAVASLRERFPAESGDAADPVEFAVRLHLEDLPDLYLGRAAMLLLRTCAFLGSCGLPWRTLRSPEMLTLLAGENPELSDPVLLSIALHQLARRGLLLLDDAELLPGDITQTPLRVHPRVLRVVRDSLSPEQRARFRAQVSSLLAAGVAGPVDDVVEGAAGYSELLEHIGPCGAKTQTDDAVRRWLVNQVRFLWESDNRGSWQTAARLGESLRERWLASLPGNPEARRDDPIMLRLNTQLANVYRSLGRLSEARELDQYTLTRQRQALGPGHPRTLMTARSYAADLRQVGDFEEALLTDHSTLTLTAQAMGRNHLQTVLASGNLALSELVSGDHEHALQRRLEHDLPCCEPFERKRPGETAWVLGHIGILQRELGQYRESGESLRQARAEFTRAAPGGATAPSSLMALRVESGIAITERRLGQPRPETNEQVLEQCRAMFGQASPLVWAITLSLAGDWAELGQPGKAVRFAQEALREHDGFFGPAHPFTWICQVDLAGYALADGQLDLADEMSGSAHRSLESSLNPRHLWTLAAAVTRANVLAVTGRLADAAAIEEPTQAVYRERLGADHQFTTVVADNERHTARLRNEPGPVADPVREAAQRRWIELDIPPF